MRRINLLLLLLLLGYVACFAYFRNAHARERDRAKQAIAGLLRNESLAGNTYALSKSVLDLERLGLISCSKIFEGEANSSPFYNSSANEGCAQIPVLRSLLEDEISLKAINGTFYLIQLQFPLQWQLTFTEALTYMLLSAWIFIYLRHIENQRIKSAAAEALHRQNLQISHDIRSPVTVLATVTDKIQFANEQDQIIFKAALSRLGSTANGLLTQLKKNEADRKCFRFSLDAALEGIVKENLWLQNAKQSRKSIEWKNSLGGYSLSIDESSSSLLIRAIQNLIQNAIEASPVNGAVKVHLDRGQGGATITIQDQGAGIPTEIAAALGKEIVSSKASGTGLGFLNAKEFIERIGGNISLQSSSNGTSIKINLPQAEADPASLALIDNDPLIRDLWIRAANKRNLPLEVFNSIREFTARQADIGRDWDIYLDVEREDGVTIEDAVSLLKRLGFERIWICTAHPAAIAADISEIIGVVGKEPPFL